MQIGELASAVGVNTKTVRYYEEIGLVPPADRAANGYRVYGDEARERLRFIKDAQATGLTLDEISTVLHLRGDGVSTCHHILGLLDHHLADLDDRIKAMKKTKRELAAIVERAHGLDPAECTDPNRCQTITRQSSFEKTPPAHLHNSPGPHRH